MSKVKIKNPNRIFLALFLFAVSILLLHTYIVGFTIYSDGVLYYSYLRSAVFDKDINFTNEFEHYKNVTSKVSGLPIINEDWKNYVSETMEKTGTGYYPNHHSFGNALLWAPFYICAHILTLILNFFSINLAVDGYSLLYELSAGLASIIYGFLGIFIIYKFCQKFYSKKVSFIAAVAVLLGTSIFWFVSIEPTFAHANSVFLVSLFIYRWYTKKNKTKPDWAILGLIFGLAVLVRRQNIIFLLLPCLGWLADLRLKHFLATLHTEPMHQLSERFKTFFNITREAAFFMMPIIPMYLLQVFIWKIMFNEWFWFWLMNVGVTSQFTTANNRLLPMIFSTKCGMIIMPILLISLVGLGLFTKKHKLLGTAFLTIFILQLITLSFWGYPQEPVCGYTMYLRLFINCTLFYAVGVCEITQRFKEKGKLRLWVASIVLFILFNFFNMVRFAIRR